MAIRLTTLSNKNSSYPTSEYLPPICLISEYGNLFRYSYPLTQESRPQLLGSLSPGVSQTHSIGNSILSSTTDSSLWFHSECTLFAHRLFVFNFYGLKISTLLSICQFYLDRKSTRLNSSHRTSSRMPSSAWKKKKKKPWQNWPNEKTKIWKSDEETAFTTSMLVLDSIAYRLAVLLASVFVDAIFVFFFFF